MGIHIAQLSIAWILGKPGVACALVGSRNKGQLLTNAGAVEVDLSPEIIAEIDNLSEPVLEVLGDNPDYYESLENTRIR